MDLLVVDVPTIICDKFQQSVLFVNVEVPQIQFFDRMLDFSSVLRHVYPQCKLCRRPMRFHSCSPWTRLMQHTIYELCLPSERGLVCVWIWQTPVSCGKYSGTCVSTAPVAEPTELSFTVPFDGCTIVATATVVTTCPSSADCPDSAAPMCWRGCLRRDVVWWWRFHS